MIVAPSLATFDPFVPMVQVDILRLLKRSPPNITNSPNVQDEVSGTSTISIIVCNAVAIFACLVALILYSILSFNPKYMRLMRRTSLALAACMATSDLVLHSANLVGYGPLPSGFTCGFVGGWLFATPSILSVFYSCCIALNSQLVFTFHRRPLNRALPYYILIPLFVTFAITFAALGSKSFGYDATWGYCWYSTEGVSPSLVLIRLIFTYSLPTLLGMLYLIIATITISIAVFSKRSSLNRPNRPNELAKIGDSTPVTEITEPRSSSSPNTQATFNIDRSMVYSQSLSAPFSDRPSTESHSFPPTPTLSPPPAIGNRHNLKTIFEKVNESRLQQIGTKQSSSIDQPPSVTGKASLSAKPEQPTVHVRLEKRSRKASRKAAMMRQLTIRLIGYIVCPILCLLPGIILDLVTKVRPNMHVPTGLNGLFDGLNGLVGLFNSLLMLSDPALLAIWGDMKNIVETKKDASWLGKVFVGLKALFGMKVVDEEIREKKARRASADVLASSFGLGARTRIDHLEEGLSEIEGRETLQGRKRDSARSYRMERRRSDGVVLEETSPRPRTSDLWSTEEWDTKNAGIGGDQALEVRVTVDVTRVERSRVSRVELTEDWLAGL